MRQLSIADITFNWARLTWPALALRHADPRAQMFGIGGDRENRLGGGLEQKVVNHRLVLMGDVADRRRQGEDHVIIGDRQQLGLAQGQPSLRRRALMMWTASPQRHHSAKAWPQERHKEGGRP